MRSVGESILGLADPVDARDVYLCACAAVEEELDRCEATRWQVAEKGSSDDVPGVHAVLAEMADWLATARQGIASYDSPLRVVLLGRTMAGKSSLFCCLTGADRKRIGEGGQATTRGITRLPLLVEPGIEVSDTPGVGALDRLVDRIVALEEARRADIVVWLCTDDSFQAEEQDALEEVLNWGVPVVLALHCFLDLTNPARLRRFLKQPDAQPRQLLEQSPDGGHLARPLRTFRRRSQLPVAVIPFHAGAALAADRHPELRDDLFDASNLDQLTTLLLRQVDVERDLRRTSAAVDSCRQTLDEGRRRSELSSGELARIHTLSEKARMDLERRSTLMLDSANVSLHDEAQAAMASFDAWADEHYRNPNAKAVNALLNDDLEVAVADMEKDFIRRADRLQAQLGELGASIASQWAALGAQASDVTVDVGGSWQRKLPSRWRKGVAVGVISIVGMAVSVVADPWAGGVVVNVGIGLVDKIPWVGGRKAALTQRRADLQAEVSKVCEAVMAEMLDHWKATVDEPLRESISARLGQSQLANEEVGELAEQFSALAARFGDGAAELDSVLVRALLELEGHGDLAGTVRKVQRVPGSECAVTLDHPPHLTAMRSHPYLRSAAFLSPDPEPRAATLTRLLGRRATRGWRAVPANGSSNDLHRLLIVPPSAQLAGEAQRVAEFASQVLGVPVEVGAPPQPPHDNDHTGASL